MTFDWSTVVCFFVRVVLRIIILIFTSNNHISWFKNVKSSNNQHQFISHHISLNSFCQHYSSQ
jgi:hypothetical protein